MGKSINSVSQKTEDIMDQQQLPPGIHKKLRLLGSSQNPKSMDHAAGENPRDPSRVTRMTCLKETVKSIWKE